ncbi:hypothetical protein MHBO_003184 [Bonamia ostreae]|uniref:Uncharacterized protein n=1 Tax=Bonamia ostreae TaxID=126728 RepID=A0ABV2AQ36_9EUKA
MSKLTICLCAMSTVDFVSLEPLKNGFTLILLKVSNYCKNLTATEMEYLLDILIISNIIIRVSTIKLKLLWLKLLYGIFIIIAQSFVANMVDSEQQTVKRTILFKIISSS